MAVNDVYRPNVDYTLGEQVTSPISGKTAFIPYVNVIGGPGGAMAGSPVAASQTDEELGDGYISHIVIQPATASPGVVTLVAGAVTYVAFPGGASSVPGLAPITVPLGISDEGWELTTGADVSVVVYGVLA